MEKKIRALKNHHAVDKDKQPRLCDERETYRLGCIDLVEVHISQHKSCVSLSVIFEDKNIELIIGTTSSTLPYVERPLKVQAKSLGRSLA